MRRSVDRRGANAIEFGLIALPLMMLLTGIMDYGWYFVGQHVATRAADKGARAAATTARDMDPDGVGKTSALEEWAAAGLDGEPLVTVARDGDPERVSVTVSIESAPLVGLVPMPENVTATSSRRMEEQPES